MGSAKPTLGYPSRKAAAVALRDAGHSTDEIAEKLSCDRQRVYQLLNAAQPKDRKTRKKSTAPAPTDDHLREIRDETFDAVSEFCGSHIHNLNKLDPNYLQDVQSYIAAAAILRQALLDTSPDRPAALPAPIAAANAIDLGEDLRIALRQPANTHGRSVTCLVLDVMRILAGDPTLLANILDDDEVPT